MKNREVVITTEVSWEKGFVYFAAKDENGNVRIDRAKPTGRPNPKETKRYKKLIEEKQNAK